MYPILFQIGGIEVYSNAIILLIGMITCFFLLTKVIKEKNLSITFLNDYFFSIILSFLFFGKIGIIFLKLDFYILNPLHIFYFWDGNFSFFIGLISTGIVFYFLSIFEKENVLKWIDALFPIFLIGMLFLSIGDFLSGANYGIPTSTFLGMVFDLQDVRYTLPIHPTQLYEFAGVLGLIFFIKMICRKKRLTGVCASFGFFLFFLMEFILEFFRASVDTLLFGYKFNQILFLIILIACLMFFIFRSHKNTDVDYYKKKHQIKK